MIKLLFPVILPAFNDKIIVRVWDNRILNDLFIAAIPEIASDNDFFNLNYLLTIGCIMRYT